MLLVSFHAVANTLKPEDCGLQLEALVPVFNPKAAGIEVLSAPILKDRTLSESIVMEEGIEATYTVGGCEHFGYTLTYKNVPGVTKEISTRDMISTAEDLLKKSPFTAEFDRSRSHWLLNLKTAKKTPIASEGGFVAIECGDPDCGIRIPDQGQLEISFDFPL